MYIWPVLVTALSMCLLQHPPSQHHEKKRPPAESKQNDNPEQSIIPEEKSRRPDNERTDNKEGDNMYGMNPAQVTAIATVAYVAVTFFLFFAVSAQVLAYWAKERAWMVMAIQPGSTTHADKGITIFRGAMHNVGHSPARILKMDDRYLVLKRQDSLPPVPPYIAEPRAKQAFFVVAPMGGGKLIHWRVPQTDMDEVERGEKVLWLFGCVRYKDIFRRKRESRYCFRYYPGIAGSIDPDVGFFPDGPPEYSKLS